MDSACTYCLLVQYAHHNCCFSLLERTQWICFVPCSDYTQTVSLLTLISCIFYLYFSCMCCTPQISSPPGLLCKSGSCCTESACIVPLHVLQIFARLWRWQFEKARLPTWLELATRSRVFLNAANQADQPLPLRRTEMVLPF